MQRVRAAGAMSQTTTGKDKTSMLTHCDYENRKHDCVARDHAPNTSRGNLNSPPHWSLVCNTGSRQSTSLSVGHPQPAQNPGAGRGALLLRLGPLPRPGPHTPLWEATSAERGSEAAALHPVQGLGVKREGSGTLRASEPLPRGPTALARHPQPRHRYRPPQPSGEEAGWEGERRAFPPSLYGTACFATSKMAAPRAQ